MKFSAFSMVLFEIFLVGSIFASPQVIVNEVLSNAPGRESGSGSPGDRMEFIELYNRSEVISVDIGGWSISDGDAVDYIESWEGNGADSLGGSLVVNGTTRMGPGDYVLILDPEYFDGGEGGWFDIAENTLVVTIGNTTLGNGLSTNDPVILCDLDGDTISTFGTPGWDDGFPDDPGDGRSWERIDPEGEDGEENWTECGDDAGATPGKRNSFSIPVDLSFVENSLVLDPPNPAEGGEVQLTAIIWNQGLSETMYFEIEVYLDRNRDGSVSDDEVVQHVAVNQVLLPGDSATVASSIVAVESGFHVVGMQARHAEEGDLSDNSVEREMKVGDVPARIVMNEILYDPHPGGEEWIEIFNRSHDRVDIRGWELEDTRTTGCVDGESIVMESGSYAILIGDPTRLVETFPSLDDRQIVVVSPFPSLGNRGDTLRLVTVDGYTVERIEYLSRWGGGDGISLERVNPLDAVPGPSNWGSSVDHRGSTPGEQNSICQVFEGKAASLEVMPGIFSPDNDGHDDRTVISYRLPVPRARVKIEVFDVMGRRVDTVLDQVESGSEGQVVWDGRDERGSILSIGIYIVYLEAIDPFSGYFLREKRGVVLGGVL